MQYNGVQFFVLKNMVIVRFMNPHTESYGPCYAREMTGNKNPLPGQYNSSVSIYTDTDRAQVNIRIMREI